MRAVRYHDYGDADVLKFEDADMPQPASGQVLIQVAATAFNPVDVGIRAGFLRDVFPVRFPHIPGIEVAGKVAELGEGVTNFSVGDAVIGFLPMSEDGAAAEFVLAPAEALVDAPRSIPLADAAAIPVGALTASQALFEHAGLHAGQRVLINGAGGGVGGFAVQLAKQAGATVIATASPRSTDSVRAAGADQIVDYASTTVFEAVTEPVDVVLNLVSVSEDGAAALVGLVRPGGVLVTTTGPVAGDPERDVRTAWNQLRSDPDRLAVIVAGVDAGELHVDVSARHPLADTALIHEQSVAGQLRGKVVLTAS